MLTSKHPCSSLAAGEAQRRLFGEAELLSAPSLHGSDFPARPWLLQLVCRHTELNLLVILFTGVGTRNYYRKIGYELEGPYMVKRLD